MKPSIKLLPILAVLLFSFSCRKTDKKPETLSNATKTDSLNLKPYNPDDNIFDSSLHYKLDNSITRQYDPRDSVVGVYKGIVNIIDNYPPGSNTTSPTTLQLIKDKFNPYKIGLLFKDENYIYVYEYNRRSFCCSPQYHPPWLRLKGDSLFISHQPSMAPWYYYYYLKKQ